MQWIACVLHDVQIKGILILKSHWALLTYMRLVFIVSLGTRVGSLTSVSTEMQFQIPFPYVNLWTPRTLESLITTRIRVFTRCFTIIIYQLTLQLIIFID